MTTLEMAQLKIKCLEIAASMKVSDIEATAKQLYSWIADGK